MAEELPADLVEKAERELGETPSVRARALAELRQKVQSLKAEEQPHRTDDQYLLAFLRPQKFRVDVALQKLKAYTAFKRKHAEILKNMNAKDFDELTKADFFRPLLKRDKGGRMVIWLFPSRMNPLKNPDLMISWNIFSLEQMGFMFDPYMQVNGVVIVEDLEGFGIVQAMRMMTGPMKKVQDTNFKFMQEACPYRLQGMLLINQPVYMDVIIAFVRPFMPRKLLSRIQLLGRGQEGLKALKERVGEECMPPEMGGTLAEKPGDFLRHAELLEKEGRTVQVS